jgi:hypothetical protein
MDGTHARPGLDVTRSWYAWLPVARCNAKASPYALGVALSRETSTVRPSARGSAKLLAVIAGEVFMEALS